MLVSSLVSVDIAGSGVDQARLVGHRLLVVNISLRHTERGDGRDGAVGLLGGDGTGAGGGAGGGAGKANSSSVSENSSSGSARNRPPTAADLKQLINLQSEVA